MNVTTMTMSKGQARTKLREYRKGLHRKADAEWERIEAAYKELANGRPLLVLSDVIAAAPKDAQGRPRLAIMRADQRQVHFRHFSYNGFATFEVERGWRPRGRAPLDTLISVPLPGPATTLTGYSLVPIVPPDVQKGHALARHHILWEVERWSDTPIGVQPDRDPYLLRRIDADLFAVVGEWDLTDVERAVMGARRQG